MIRRVKIGDLGEIITGNTPPRSKPEYYGAHTPFIKATDINESSKYTYCPEEYYSKIGYDKYQKSLIPKGSTCVVTIGSIGKKMTMTHRDCFINQAMNAIIPSSYYDSEYVYYVMKNNIHRLKSLDSGTASGRENVSKSAFSNLEIDVIDDIVIQRKIGSILSHYDKLIENNQKQIKLLEEAAQRLYKEWFVDLHFPGYEDVTIVDGVPEDWKEDTIGNIFTTVLGGTPSRSNSSYWNGDIPWINSGEVNNLRIMNPSEHITKLGLEKSSTKLMPKHTTVLAITGATLGQVSYTEIETCANQSVVGIYDNNDIYSIYIYLYVSNNIKSMIGKATGGAQQHINKDIVNAYDIVLPNEMVINKLNEIIRPYFDKIANLYMQNSKFVEIRDRLLPKLMSGEIEV